MSEQERIERNKSITNQDNLVAECFVIKDKIAFQNKISTVLAFSGNAIGLIYGIKTKKSNWQNVGLFLLGGAILGTVGYLATLNSTRNLKTRQIELGCNTGSKGVF